MILQPSREFGQRTFWRRITASSSLSTVGRSSVGRMRRSIGHVRWRPDCCCSCSQKSMHSQQKVCREAQPGSRRGRSMIAKQIGQRRAYSSSSMTHDERSGEGSRAFAMNVSAPHEVDAWKNSCRFHVLPQLF
eukprot:7377229-Prymnesium_polylepis.1